MKGQKKSEIGIYKKIKKVKRKGMYSVTQSAAVEDAFGKVMKAGPTESVFTVKQLYEQSERK